MKKISRLLVILLALMFFRVGNATAKKQGQERVDSLLTLLPAAKDNEKCQVIEDYKATNIALGAPYFEIRKSIPSGHVVAGMVGVKKFAYDIWGDTVNIASRMESSGEAGKLNISGSNYDIVKDTFNCTYGGKVEAKNKGMIDMYFVENAENSVG
jgi:class 3 adenylate cyclase